MKIAIIGAGLAGVTFTRKLSKNFDVTVFEKSRGIGGRLATRYAEPYEFDHGAQFFICKTPEFQNLVDELELAGVVAKWDPEFVEIERNKVVAQRKWGDENPHYVAVPKMNNLCKFLAKDLQIKLQVKVQKIERAGQRWAVFDEADELLGEFDWVVLAVPSQQAAELMPQEFLHRPVVEAVKMVGAYALMLGFKQPLNIAWQAALVKQADISWVSVNSSKPCRETGFSLLVNSTNKWAEENLEADQEWVKAHLLAELSVVVGQDVSHAEIVQLHRWKYANVAAQKLEPALIDFENKLAACGDWCIQGRVEAAFLSGEFLANNILEKIQ